MVRLTTLAILSLAALSPRALAKPITPAESATSPKLNKTQIREVVRKHSKQVRSCYEKAAKSDKKLAGQLGVEITIGASGRVTNARVLFSTLGRPAVDYCVVHGIRSWRFPSPRGGEVVFVYPFLFQQKGGRSPVPERLGKASVGRGMRLILEKVRQCKRFSVVGTAKVLTTIGNDGRVSEAKITEAPFADTEAGSCIETAVKTARFPRFTGNPITFTYPFVLR